MGSFSDPIKQYPEASFVFKQLGWHAYFGAPSCVASFRHLLEFACGVDFFDFESSVLEVSAYAGEDVCGGDFEVGFVVGLHDFDDFFGDFYGVVEVSFFGEVWRLKGGYGDSAFHVSWVWGFDGADYYA